MRHFLDVHAAFAGSNEGHLLRLTVGHDGEVILFLDVRAVFNIEAPHLLAFGAGLVGLELHAQNLAGQLLDLVKRFGNLDAAALAAATRVDLGLHNPYRAAELLRRFDRFLHCKRRDATRHRHTELTQDLLALVFVDLHEAL